MKEIEKRFTTACEQGEIPGVALLARDKSGTFFPFHISPARFKTFTKLSIQILTLLLQ